MKVLVTGATGFVGRALCGRLKADDWQVYGTIRNERKAMGLCAGVVPVQLADIGPDTDWGDCLRGIDTVIHLAARVHVKNDKAINPLALFRQANVTATANLARQAAAAGARRLVFLSTVKVNGEGQPGPYTENDEPAPEDFYGVSKWEAEKELGKVSAETGLEVVIIRTPLVYGPGVKANFLSLLQIVHGGVPLPLGSARNCRSFIYIRNLVDAVSACILHPNAAGQCYLVSDGEDVSTPELIRRIACALEKPARLFPFPDALIRLAGAVTGTSPAANRLLVSLTLDSSKIGRELGWKPPYTMEQGLKETANWFKNRET